MLWVDPTNSKTLVFGGTVIYRSTDGGNTKTDIGGQCPSCVHIDDHVVINDPNYNGSSNKKAYCGTDGGIFSTQDILASPVVWTSLNHTLAITQFYGGAGNASSGTIIGGTQDNATIRYTPQGGSEGWTKVTDSGGGCNEQILGCDGGVCAADPTDANYFYGEFPGLFIFRSHDGAVTGEYIYCGIDDTGNGANWAAPLVLDPNNPNTLLGGGPSLWRSTNPKAPDSHDVIWTNIKARTTDGSPIWSIAVAAGSSNIIWVGHNSGAVYYTTNGTSNNPTWTLASNGSPPLPQRICESLAIDPQNSNRVYATFSGFNSDDVWRTDDAGVLCGISTGVAAIPVHSVVVSPFSCNNVAIGTDQGISRSSDMGVHWSPSNSGPANVETLRVFWLGSRLIAVSRQGRSNS